MSLSGGEYHNNYPLTMEYKMKEERLKILKMFQEGNITTEDAISSLAPKDSPAKLLKRIEMQEEEIKELKERTQEMVKSIKQNTGSIMILKNKYNNTLSFNG